MESLSGHPAAPDDVTVFLCGDVMTGRGIDQILAQPSAPMLYEAAVRDARDYVALAERAHGPLPRPVDAGYVWGEALHELARQRPLLRIVNLETSVTTSAAAEPKGINYRMHPANVDVLVAARIDCAVLANNHVLDWGVAGLGETVETLQAAGIRTTGAGRSRETAGAPAIFEHGGGRILVFGVGGPDCGIPPHWDALDDTSGVFRIDDYSQSSLDRLSRAIAEAREDRDLVIVSIHWGDNWGWDIPDEHRRFAHALIDQVGIALVHGHSSHHPKGIEVHHERAILYGCGDFLNDYEGIRDRSEYRGDLTFMYFATLDRRTGALRQLRLVPLVIRGFRLRRPGPADRGWLFAVMRRECARLGTSLEAHDHTLLMPGR